MKPGAYDIGGGAANEAYVLRRCGDGWEVFLSEFGREADRYVFFDESQACYHFHRLIIKDDSTLR